MKIESLYQELILQHYRSPRNRGTIDVPDAEISMNNPVCGDEITLQLRMTDGRVSEARFSGHGCSISQASASMMTDRLRGKTLQEARLLSDRFLEMLHGSTEAARDPDLGDLRALAGVARFPVRVKCALLPWNAFTEAEKALLSLDRGM